MTSRCIRLTPARQPTTRGTLGRRGLLVLGLLGALAAPTLAQRPVAPPLNAPSSAACRAKPQSLDVQSAGPVVPRTVQVQALWCRTAANGTRVEVAFRGDTQIVANAKPGCGTQSPCAIVDAETLAGEPWRAMIDRKNGIRVLREHDGKAEPVTPETSRIRPARREEGVGQWRAAFVLDSTLRVRQIEIVLPGGARLRAQPPAAPRPILKQTPGATPPTPEASTGATAPRDVATHVTSSTPGPTRPTARSAPPVHDTSPPPRLPAEPLKADTGSSAARTALLPWQRVTEGARWGLPPIAPDTAPARPVAPPTSGPDGVVTAARLLAADTIPRPPTWGLPPAPDQSASVPSTLWDLPPASGARDVAPHWSASLVATAATPVDGRVPARGATTSLGGNASWQSGSRYARLELAPPPPLLPWAPFQPEPNRRFAVILDDARPEFRPWRSAVGTLLWVDSWAIDATGGLLAMGNSAGHAPWSAMGTVNSLGQASGAFAEVGHPDQTRFSLRTTGMRDAVPTTLAASRFPWRTMTSASVHLGGTPVAGLELPATWGTTAVYHRGLRLGEAAGARDGAALFVGGPVAGVFGDHLKVRLSLERYASALHLVSPAYSPWEGTQRGSASLEWAPAGPAARSAVRLRLDSDWLGRLPTDTTTGGLAWSRWPTSQEWHLRARWGAWSSDVVRPWVVSAGLDSYRYGPLQAHDWPRIEAVWTPWRRAAATSGREGASATWVWSLRAHAEQTPLFATGARGRIAGGTATLSRTEPLVRGWLLLAGFGQAWQCGAPLPMGVAWTSTGTLETPGVVQWIGGCRPTTNTGGAGAQAWARLGQRLRWDGEVRWWRDAGTIRLADPGSTDAAIDGTGPTPSLGSSPLTVTASPLGSAGIPLGTTPVLAARGQIAWRTPWGMTAVGRLLWQRGGYWQRHEGVLAVEWPWRRGPEGP